MDKFFLDKDGKVVEFSDENRRKNIRFPVCLSVSYGDKNPLLCADFILNISKGGIYIMTENPLKKGAAVKMDFYIPPDNKLLGTYDGIVVRSNAEDTTYPTGMHVEFKNLGPDGLKAIEDFLEEKRRLVDEEA